MVLVLATFTPPWIPRIPILKSLLPINLEASLKITSLTSDLSSALHTLKSQNQSLAESQHKISLLEHRNAKSTQQAELAAKKEEELEGELAKMKKSERKWEEIVEALNGEMEVLERENGLLKSGVGVGTGVGAGGVGVPANVGPTGAVEQESGQTVESNLDHAQLLDQVCSSDSVFIFSLTIVHSTHPSETHFVSCAWKIRISKDKIYFEIYRLFLLFLNLGLDWHELRLLR